MAPASTVDRLNVRLPGALSAEERAAWGRRAARSLREVDLDPPGLPPSAILVVRRLSDPLPRALFVGEPWQAATAWGEAARASLGQQWRSAGRPFRSPVGSEAPAVWFADPAEWLACLSLDLRRTQAVQRWWWRSWLAQGPAAGGLASLWTAEARWLPAALVLLAQRQAGEAAEVVAALSDAEAGGVRRALVQAHRLPARLADSHLDLERCRALLPGRRLVLPAERVPAELLALALTIGSAPALAHDPRLTTGHLTDASGHGEPASGDVSPAFQTLALASSSSDSATARSATQQADPTRTDSALDAAPAHAHDPFAAPDERGSASAEPASGQAAERDVRPSLSQPTGQPSDELPAQIENTEGSPAPIAPEDLREMTRLPQTLADGDDAAVITSLSAPNTEAPAPADLTSPGLDEAGVETDLGGIWYLVNLLVTLWLDDVDAEPADAWSVLRELAADLLHGEPPDPVWSILDHLSVPPPPFSPSPAHRDVGVADVRAAQRRGLGGEGLAQRSRAWLADAGFTPDEIPALLCQPARLFVTRTHVDLIFRLDQIDLRARLAGLDRDPGCVTAFGRVISFQYR